MRWIIRKLNIIERRVASLREILDLGTNSIYLVLFHFLFGWKVIKGFQTFSFSMAGVSVEHSLVINLYNIYFSKVW